MKKNRILTHSPSLFDAPETEAFALEHTTTFKHGSSIMEHFLPGIIETADLHL